VAELACERLERASATDVARELENFLGPLTQEEVKALERGPKDAGVFPLAIGCGKHLSFALISASHAAVLLACLFGLALAAFQAASRQLWLATAVLCASVCLAGVLLRFEKIDRMCRVEAEVRRLSLQSRMARRRHEQVAAFHEKVQAVTLLWLHRTMPQLEIFEALFDLLWGPSAASTDAALYAPLAEKLAEMRGGLGPLCKWRGEEAMRVDQLQETAGQLCACADFIKAKHADVSPDTVADIIQHLSQMDFTDASSEAEADTAVAAAS